MSKLKPYRIAELRDIVEFSLEYTTGDAEDQQFYGDILTLLDWHDTTRPDPIRDELVEALKELNSELDNFWNQPPELKVTCGFVNDFFVQRITIAQKRSHAALAKEKATP